jgi:hypothetical protein
MSQPDPPGAPPGRAPDGRAFWIALVVVGVMILGGAGLVGAVLLAGDHGPGMPVAAGGVLELETLPDDVAMHYEFADRHHELYRQVPCFCGCDAALDHRHLLDCFVRPGGGWERHASGCIVCLEESEIIREMSTRGAPAADIVETVVARFTMDTSG